MLHVQCLGCRTSAYTENNADPDGALTCVEGAGCCVEDHSHAGQGCRPVAITVMPGSIQMQPTNQALARVADAVRGV